MLTSQARPQLLAAASTARPSKACVGTVLRATKRGSSEAVASKVRTCSTSIGTVLYTQHSRRLHEAAIFSHCATRFLAFCRRTTWWARQRMVSPASSATLSCICGGNISSGCSWSTPTTIPSPARCDPPMMFSRMQARLHIVTRCESDCEHRPLTAPRACRGFSMLWRPASFTFANPAPAHRSVHNRFAQARGARRRTACGL